MVVDKQQFTKYNPPKQQFYTIAFFISFLIFIGGFLLTFFCPAIFFNQGHKYINLATYIHYEYIKSSVKKLVAQGYIYWILRSIAALLSAFFMWDVIKRYIDYITYRPWLKKYIDEHTKIINSCDTSTFNDKVAMLVFTCNDIAPNTILQTKNQTYKHMDCWICDDSSKPEQIKKVNDFVKAHPEIKLYRRSVEHKKAHPSKIGSMYAWLDAHGREYDFVFENDSSSLVTNTFIENSLCYYHSSMLSHIEKKGGVSCCGVFYNYPTLISWINMQSFHYGQAHSTISSARMSGHPIYLQGWAALFPVKCLMDVDLNFVECPVDDVSKSAHLVSKGYTHFFNPIDFSGKIGIRDIDGWTKQRLKWTSAFVYCARKKITWGSLPVKSKAVKLHAFFYALNGYVLFLATFVSNLASVVFGLFVKTHFPNFASTFFIGCIWGVVVTTMIIIGLVNRSSLSALIGAVIGGFIQRCLLFKKIYESVVNGFILKKWSTASITKKTNTNTTFKQKCRMCLFDLIWIIIFISLCLILQFVCHYSPNAVWGSFFMFFATPSIIFIVCAFIGEIKIKNGWDQSMEMFDGYYLKSERYNIVKESKIWKQQHPEKL